MIDLLRIDCLDEGQPVRNPRRVRQQFAHPGSGAAAPREREFRGHHRKGGLRRRHARQPLAAANRFRKLGILKLHQARFIVEQFEL